MALTIAKHLREVRLGIKNLLLHKLRSFLTMLGMVFGVGSVIAMLAVGEGASAEALAQIRKLGSNNILISAQKPTEETSQTNTRAHVSIYGLTYDDEQRLRETIPHIVRTAPVKVVRKEARLGDRALDVRIMATTPEWFDLVRRPVVAGRVLSANDMELFGAVVVLTEHGARRLLATEATIGQNLRLGSDYYEVIGIVHSESGQGSAIQTPDQDVDAYIPLSVGRTRIGDVISQTTAGTRTREQIELHLVIAEVDRIENVEATAAAIERLLQNFHKKNDYSLSVPLALLRQAEATKRQFNIVLGSIAGISLVVGGIGIMNIMLASVTERTREIGIRRAIGAKRRQIIAQFVIETMVLSTTGGLLGIAVGITLPWIITRIAGMPTIVTGYSLVLSLGISMAVGMIFGLYPAIRAAALDPIIALRHE